MKKILFFLLLIPTLAYATKYESNDNTVNPSSLYGHNNSGGLTAVAVDNTGKLSISGSGSGTITAVGDVTTGDAGTAAAPITYAYFKNATSGTIQLQTVTGALGTKILSLPAANDTLMGQTTTDTLQNKTFDTTGTGNILKLSGTTITSATGSGSSVATTSGAFTNTHCISVDSNNNFVDSGAACNTGIGNPNGLSGQIEYNNGGSFGGVTASGVDSSGNIGIGTVTPVSRLSVSGGATIGAAYVATTAPSNGLLVSGNVGINTTTTGSVPQALTVVGTVQTTGFKMATGAVSGYVLTTNSVGVGTWLASSGGTGTPASPVNSIQFNSSGAFGGSANLLWDGTNVGISSVNPISTLDVGPGTITANTLQTTGSTAGAISTANGMQFDGTHASLTTPNLTITTGGNIGVGTSTAAQKLDVSGTAQMTGLKLNLAPLAGGNVLVSNSVGVGTWMPPATIGVSGGGSSQWTTTGSDIYYNTGGTAVGATSLTSGTKANITQSTTGGYTLTLSNASEEYANISSASSSTTGGLAIIGFRQPSDTGSAITINGWSMSDNASDPAAVTIYGAKIGTNRATIGSMITNADDDVLVNRAIFGIKNDGGNNMMEIFPSGNVGINSISPKGTLDLGLGNTPLQMPGIKATTGTRYLCIDTNGKVTSSASACSGT